MKRRGALAVPGVQAKKVPTLTPNQRVSANNEVETTAQESVGANKAETPSKYVVIDVGGDRFRAKRWVQLSVLRP